MNTALLVSIETVGCCVWQDMPHVNRHVLSLPSYRILSGFQLKCNMHFSFLLYIYTGCFTTLGHNCKKWFPMSLWSTKFIQTCVRFWTVTELWAFFIPVHALVWTASVIRASSLSRHLSDNYEVRGKAGWVGFTTERQPVLRPAVAFSNISFKHR
jgi:hypothetical protein